MDLSPDAGGLAGVPVLAGDCRGLAFADKSKGASTVQGGLHNCQYVRAWRVFAERARCSAEGPVVFVEPWLKPFFAWCTG